jgi:photosystem II stability/assembly factor-like uncharacterized protein
MERAASVLRTVGPLLAVIALVVGGAFALSAVTGDDKSAPGAAGLPDAPDYHSLLVGPENPNEIVLGTHDGLFRSGDGGKTWAHTALEHRDAMSLSPAGETLWVAGHGILARSGDGGETWEEVEPPGLPYLDVHAFTVDPRDPANVYAAIAGQGLYRSTNGGTSFRRVSRKVGPEVMALALTASGCLLAGDMRQGSWQATTKG